MILAFELVTCFHLEADIDFLERKCENKDQRLLHRSEVAIVGIAQMM
jgi:hypothetical protein